MFDLPPGWHRLVLLPLTALLRHTAERAWEGRSVLDSRMTYSGTFLQWRWYQAPKSKLAFDDATR